MRGGTRAGDAPAPIARNERRTRADGGAAARDRLRFVAPVSRRTPALRADIITQIGAALFGTDAIATV